MKLASYSTLIIGGSFYSNVAHRVSTISSGLSVAETT